MFQKIVNNILNINCVACAITGHIKNNIIISQNIQNLSMTWAFSPRKNFIILNQSNGGMGIRLNIANQIFNILNLIRNKFIMSIFDSNIDVIGNHNVLEYIRIINIQTIDNNRFVAGHHSATINSHLSGFL